MKVSRAEVIQTRERILVSAARLFRKHGFDGVNVARIMKTAGLTHGAFYGYFKSKDDLIAQVLARILMPGPDIPSGYFRNLQRRRWPKRPDKSDRR